MVRRTALIGVVVLLGVVLRAAAGAAPCDMPPPGQCPQILPPVQYDGSLWDRETLTGNWGSLRDEWFNKGVLFDANVTQIGQGVVDGGKNGSWEYGGRGNLTAYVDTCKAGLWPGGIVKAELEGNWDDAVNLKSGGLMPVNSNALFPIPGGGNVALPDLSIVQFVAPYAGVQLGKIDTMGGDMNDFAHGKGDTQFFNLGFNINPVALVVPYSTLAASAIILPTCDINEAIVNFSVLSASGTASTSGFGTTSGPLYAGEGRVRTGFFDLTGHQLVGGLYSAKNYTSLDQRLGIAIKNQQLNQRDGTWAMYYNFDQYLYETDKVKGKGVGLFGRFGASQDAPNPSHYFYSIGIGGKGLVPERDYDEFGVGYFYLDLTNPTFAIRNQTQAFLRDEWGFETYYNIALTRWLLVTPDIQVIGPAQKQQILSLTDRRTIGTATVLGIRSQVIF